MTAGSVPAARRARVTALALLAAVAVFVAGVAAALSAAGGAYRWRESMLSDLGHLGCRVWGDRWVCSPGSAWFNAALVGSGVLALASALGMRHRWGLVLTTGVAAMGVGLTWLGLVPADVSAGLHLVGAVLALPVPAVGMLVSGIRPPTRWLVPFRRVRAGAAAVALLMCADHLLPDDRMLLPRGVSELLATAVLLGFLTVEGVRLLRPRAT